MSENRLIRGSSGDLRNLKPGEVAEVSKEELKRLNRDSAVNFRLSEELLDRGNTILDAAKAIVYGDREKLYGHPREHFTRTIGMINARFAHKLKEPFVVDDWPIIMILDKVARDSGEYKRDVSIDIAGYAATLDRLQEK